MRFLKTYWMPMLSGLLLAASMPGPNLGWLAFFALIPLFLALESKSPREGFKIGFVAGASFFALLLHWIYTIWDWAGVAIIPGYFAMVLYLALYWGLFGYGLCWLGQRLPRWVLVFAAPALWVALEFLRSLTIFGFPWGQAADALYLYPSFVQIASLAGIWGVSFFVVVINCLVALRAQTGRWRYSLVALALFFAVVAWGSYETSQSAPPVGGPVIALVQPSVAQRERGDPGRLGQFISIYDQLLQEVEESPQKPDLVILPESALPAFILDNPATEQFFSSWTAAQNIPILLGTFTQDGEKVRNSVAYVGLDGPSHQVYSKVQLVPFSTEYFPGLELLDIIGLTNLIPVKGSLGRLTPGAGFQPLEIDVGPVATPICFETIFPRISREFVRNGAQVILTVTNDAWFKNTWALDQHFAKGVFRAVENRRFFVQTANSGISGFIDPWGQIIERSSIEDRSVISRRVSLETNETLFTRFGDWFVYLLLGYLALLVILSRLRGGRSPSPATSAASPAPSPASSRP